MYETNTVCKRARWPLVLALTCLAGLTSCADSPAPVAQVSCFGVMTAVGPARVSVRNAPEGMTDADFERLVRIGMDRAAADHVAPGLVSPPSPSPHIVWQVNAGVVPRGMS